LTIGSFDGAGELPTQTTYVEEFLVSEAQVSKIAIFVGHIQQPIVGMAPEGYLDRLAETLAAARAAGVSVIYAKLSFRAGYLELPDHDPMRAMVEADNLFVGGLSSTIDEAVKPLEGDIVIDAVRPSAFAYTELEPILRSRGINSIVLTGISTGGVVMGTLVDARSRDFAVTVLSDLCVESNPSGQVALLQAFTYPWAATITDASTWVTELAELTGAVG
jgi:nicotinamidase-related amidase